MAINVEKTIREYLPQVIHLSLATCSGNLPWVCELHYVFDKDLNLYFRSRSSTRHAREIESNNNVAGNIVTQHNKSEKPRGVYFEGTAKQLNNITEDHIAYILYCERFNTDDSILEEANNDDGHKFFKIKVNNYYLFDSKESSPSKKYNLSWNK